jgi:hypothetical protein
VMRTHSSSAPRMNSRRSRWLNSRSFPSFTGRWASPHPMSGAPRSRGSSFRISYLTLPRPIVSGPMRASGGGIRALSHASLAGGYPPGRRLMPLAVWICNDTSLMTLHCQTGLSMRISPQRVSPSREATLCAVGIAVCPDMGFVQEGDQSARPLVLYSGSPRYPITPALRATGPAL